MLDEYLMYIELDEQGRIHLERYEPMGEIRYGVPMISKVIYTLFVIMDAKKEQKWNIDHGFYEEAEKFDQIIRYLQNYVKDSDIYRKMVGGRDEQTD